MNNPAEQPENVTARLEALLFSYGEPISHKKIAVFLGIEEGRVAEHVTVLRTELINSNRGIVLVEEDNRVQIATKPEFGTMMQSIMKEEFSENLTPAALETLAIVAYAGPIPRSSIDYVRGVNSSFILRTLMLRGLIERNSAPEKGNVFVYSPSFDFLRHLGLSKKEDMPEFERLSGALQKLQGTPSLQ
ncbi:MAG: SMC-Scp complex subunit ScpB [Patescibacteria group bacterium]